MIITLDYLQDLTEEFKETADFAFGEHMQDMYIDAFDENDGYVELAFLITGNILDQTDIDNVKVEFYRAKRSGLVIQLSEAMIKSLEFQVSKLF